MEGKRKRVNYTEAVTKGALLKKSQNSQRDTCVRVSFLIKLQAEACNFIKKRLWYKCFPVNFTKFLRTLFFVEHLRWLLLRFD